jgi:hypothetical protein
MRDTLIIDGEVWTVVASNDLGITVTNGGRRKFLLHEDSIR